MQNETVTTRRNFIKTVSAATLGSAALLSGCSTGDNKSMISKNAVISKGDTILFQGDSITDSGRARGQGQNPWGGRGNPLGSGYVNVIAGQLMAKMPTYELNILNRGISGHKVFQLADRWDADCIDLKPDVLSILIGVNDIWHKLNGTYDGTVEIYETDYKALLERTLKELPDVKLVICEPFVLRFGSVTDEWFPDFDGYLASARKMAEEFDTLLVPFQTMFDEAVENTAPEYWTADGVHPNDAGATLMANKWLEIVGA